MNRERPHHPFQLAIEQAWDEGHTPRLLVLGERVPKGGLPAALVAAHDGRPIVLDLDPSYPMRPAFYATRAELVLSFAGFATACSIPWDAIMAVVDTATGAGFVRTVSKERHVVATPAPPAPTPREARPWAPRVLRGGKADGPDEGSSGGSGSEGA